MAHTGCNSGNTKAGLISLTLNHELQYSEEAEGRNIRFFKKKVFKRDVKNMIEFQRTRQHPKFSFLETASFVFVQVNNVDKQNESISKKLTVTKNPW